MGQQSSLLVFNLRKYIFLILSGFSLFSKWDWMKSEAPATACGRQNIEYGSGSVQKRPSNCGRQGRRGLPTMHNQRRPNIALSARLRPI
jgi:hypothetical protein